jgi:hypothetical protein
MDPLKKPDKNRLLTALRCGQADRVPNWEFVLMKRNTEAVLGRDKVQNVVERYRKLDTVWPARSESELHDRSALASYSCYLPAEEYRELLEITGQDAAVCTLSWKPKSRKPEYEGVIARGQDGIIEGMDDMGTLPKPPTVEEMMVPLDYYIESFRGSGIGVGLLVRSVFCNTYETLGMENFMLKMYDDPKVIIELFEMFYEYSLGITTEAAKRDVDFLALDDDLCDNNGFLVNPDFLKREWLGRTRKILEPFISKGAPVVFHCCGNISPVIPMALDLGVSAMQPIQPNCNDIIAYKKEYGREMCFIGNIDLAGVLTRGTPDEVRQDTKEHIDSLADGGGYVVCSSHSITDDVPPENYRAMIETAWEHGRYT